MQATQALKESHGSASAAPLDPYGQLVRMLMPRAHAIAICDAIGLPIWWSDSPESAELRNLLNELLGELGTSGGPGGAKALDRERCAYVFRLNAPGGSTVGAVGLIAREARQFDESGALARARSLLQPALECLARELATQSSIAELQRGLQQRDRDLELLLGAAPGDLASDDRGDDFVQLVQSCVDHLGCSAGALIIPEKNIAVCRTGEGTSPRHGAEILSRHHRPLLAWARQHRRTMVSERPVGAVEPGHEPLRVLSCPIVQGERAVLGILALFRPAPAGEFELRQVRLAELLTRRVSHILATSYDAATGLLTRTAFEKAALPLLSPDALRTGSNVIYVDIDRLHVVNENLGMHVGDEVIGRVAEVIRRSTTPRTLAARISGDRFALLVGGVSLEAAQQVAENLRDGCAGLGLVAGSRPVDVSASLGVAAIAQGRHPLSHALAAAEIACKAAKDRGRNRVQVYEESDRSVVRRYTDITLIGALRNSLAHDNFKLHAQPIVALDGTGPARKFELLLRMQDENGENHPPESFLSAAERYQMASDIDRWVVLHVLRSLAARADDLVRAGACFAVNISGQSLGDPAFADFLERQLRSGGLPAGLLSFEMTETATVANIGRADALIRRLRELGCAVALDDFGKGLSSLSYLRTLPVTVLKVDGSLVRDSSSDERCQAMLSAVIQLARAMGLATVAECVENEEILAVVTRLGFDFGQGFSIGRPTPLDQVIDQLLG